MPKTKCQHHNCHQCKKNGYTMWELIFSIFIIIVITLGTAWTINGLNGQSRDAVRLSDIAKIQTALTLYYEEAGEYPENIGTGLPIKLSYGNVFLDMVPIPPRATSMDCAVNGYEYTSAKDLQNYTIEYCLENSKERLKKGTCIATPVHHCYQVDIKRK